MRQGRETDKAAEGIPDMIHYVTYILNSRGKVNR